MEQYLEASFYKNVCLGEDKFFNFPDGKSIKYRQVFNGEGDMSFLVLAEKYLLAQTVNDRAKAPHLVKLELTPGSQAYSVFYLVKDAIDSQLDEEVEYCYNNYAYLNVGTEVFDELLRKCSDDAPPVVITVYERILRNLKYHKFSNKLVNVNFYL